MKNDRLPEAVSDKEAGSMNLGFVSAILPELALEPLLAFAREEGFSCVELMCWPVGKSERKYAGVTHVDVTRLSQSAADDVNGLAERYGMKISGLGYYPNPLDPDPQVSKAAVDHLKRVIVAAGKLRLRNVNTFVGRDWTKSVDANWPRFLKIWKPLIALAEEHDVRIGIENCPMYFTADEWPGRQESRRLPCDLAADVCRYSVRALWAQLRSFPLCAAIHGSAGAATAFRDKLFHLHAKDVKIYPDRLNDVGVFAEPLKWHQPRIPGYGEIDWARFMGALMESGYNGPVCIEVEDDTFGKTLAGRKKALRVARNVLQPYFA